MEKAFWTDIVNNDYKVPAGYALDELTKLLFGYLGSTDPELRDDIAYIVYAHWLKRELYSKDEMHAHVNELLGNLDQGIGETTSDSVFLRTFSVLLLAEIVHNDNKKPWLEKDQITSILARGLWYLDAEKDPRGYIPVKGWAHALAHTADLMMVLGKNRQTEKDDLEKILRAISKKMIQSTNWVYIHGEDDRLGSAVVAIFERGLTGVDEIKEWLNNLTKDWKGAWMDEDRARAYFNVRNFLRSVYLQATVAEEFPNKGEIQSALLVATQNLRPY